MPRLARAIRVERERLGISQAELAQSLHYSVQMISAVERGLRRFDQASRNRLAQLSPRLAAEVAAALEGNPFGPLYLDQVDHHPVVTTVKLGEEVAELGRALGDLGSRLVNRASRDALRREDEQVLVGAANEAYDVATGICTWLVTLAEIYELDLRMVRRQHEQKLVARRYISREEGAA